MAARVVCGCQPAAADRSSSVAPSGRETASSKVPSLPPGRAPCGSEICTRRRERIAGMPPQRWLFNADGVEPSRGDDQAFAFACVDFRIGPGRCRVPSRQWSLGDQAAVEQRLESSLERCSLQLERLGSGRTLRSARAAAAASRTAWVSESFGIFFPFGQRAAECAARH